MTLTQETFAHGMGLLAARWTQAKAPELQGVYAQYLADLEEPEFVGAVKRAVAEYEFLPSAKIIRDLARPGVPVTVQAGECFTRILDDWGVREFAEGSYRGRYSLVKIAAKYGDAAARAVTAIGGCRALDAMTDDRAPFARREFVEAFEGYAGELAARTTTERLGTPVERPRLVRGAGAPAPKAEPTRALVDRALPRGDQ